MFLNFLTLAHYAAVIFVSVIIIFLSLMYLKWIGLSKVQRPTRHILGHFRDGGVTAASARIVAAVRAHSVRGVV